MWRKRQRRAGLRYMRWPTAAAPSSILPRRGGGKSPLATNETMTQTLTAYDKYIADHRTFEADLNGGVPAWLHELRQRGLAAFEAVRFPTATRGKRALEVYERNANRQPHISGTPLRPTDSSLQTRQSRRSRRGTSDGNGWCSLTATFRWPNRTYVRRRTASKPRTWSMRHQPTVIWYANTLDATPP